MHPLWQGAKKDKRWLYSQSKANKVAVKIKQKKIQNKAVVLFSLNM